MILTLERAGAQEVVRTLAEHARPLGCRSFVCTFADGPVRGDLEALGVPVTVLGPRRHGIEALPWFVAELRGIRRRLAALVREHAIDIVQTHLLQTLDFVALSLRRVPPVEAVLWTIHNVDFLPRGERGWARCKRAAHVRLYRASAARVGGIVAVSDRVRDAVVAELGPMRGRVRAIANGVDAARYRVPSDRRGLERELGLAADDDLVLAVGRLTAQKGHRVLVAAARAVVAARPRARFLIAGEGELEAELRAAVARAGLEEHVRFLGVRTDVPRLLASADVFVLPSLWEGLSIVLLEAMASAAPIVATAVSGTDQALADGRTGLVVPPADSEALAAAIVRLLGDPVGAREMGARARATVEAARYVALYRELLGPPAEVHA